MTESFINQKSFEICLKLEEFAKIFVDMAFGQIYLNPIYPIDIYKNVGIFYRTAQTDTSYSVNVLFF